jgi:hypothetical protein
MGVQGPAPDWAPWLDQAEHDLYAARQNDASDLWDVAVTLAEQAAEKAAKAVWIDKRGELAPRIHFVGQLLRELGAPEELVKAGTATSPYATRPWMGVRHSRLWIPRTRLRRFLTPRGSCNGRRNSSRVAERWTPAPGPRGPALPG